MLKTTVARSMNRTLWRGVLASIVFGFGIPSQFELVIAGQIECLHVDTPNILTCDHRVRSEEHTSELQSRPHLVCRLLLEKKKKKKIINQRNLIRKDMINCIG